MQHFPAIIIGAGQAGLATAYYLRRQGIEPVLIDAQPGPGGAWQQYWDSLTLFSNAGFSNLPGMPMPAYDGYPPRDHVVEYFAAWEDRYEFDIRRPYVVDFVDHGEVAGFPPWSTSSTTTTTGEGPTTSRCMPHLPTTSPS